VLAERINQFNSEQFKTVKTRYHGNYHLGKVLITENDFVITDFEGDPVRPYAERRKKHLPLRDVADMLRSFNNAAYTALVHACAEKPQDLVKFEPLVRNWKVEVGQVFLTAYIETVRSFGLFQTEASLRDLLDLFLIDKALYEIRNNELNKKPESLEITMRFILSQLQPAI
jgi:maltose alpha-D-glucosyltransferase/alpha-amylase